jgi:hypothetical protein
MTEPVVKFGDIIHVYGANGYWLVLVVPDEDKGKLGALLALDDEQAGAYPGITRWKWFEAFTLVEEAAP